MTPTLQRLTWCVIWAVVTTGQTDGGQPGELAEYCDAETFQAECPKHEIIIIRVAQYGRMETSRCVTHEYQTNCFMSALSYLDDRCSGRRKCSAQVINLVPTNRQPCDHNLRSFLKASYECIPVAHADPKYCGGGGQLRLTEPVGYLSTLEANQTGCGTVDTPWLVAAQSGQVIRVTLLEFNGEAHSLNPDSETCRVIAVIRDVHGDANTKTVCATGSREMMVFTSISNMIEIRLVKGGIEKYPVLKYEMLGCKDLSAPPGGWMQRASDVITLGCNDSNSKWTMKCDGTKWLTVGRKRNCTTGVSVSGKGGKGGVWDVFSDSHSMSIVTILFIALVVGLTILVVGLVYLKRCRFVHREAPRVHGYTEDYHIAPGTTASTMAATMGSKDSERVQKQCDPDGLKTYQSTGNDYFRTWEMQRHLSSPGGISGGTLSGPGLSPPPYSEQMAGRRSTGTLQGNTKSPYVEHIYESPKFDRRDAPYSSSNEGDNIPTEYYELDPESVNSTTVNVNIPDYNIRGK